MRRLFIIALLALVGWLPAVAHAQTPAVSQPAVSQPMVESGDYGLHPVLAVVAGAVSGVVIASAVAGSLITGTLLLEGASLAESLEIGTGLTVPAIGASAVLGGLLGHFMLSH